MSTYGYNHYGKPTLYGRQRPVRVVPGGGPLPLISNAYLIDPFTAVPVDYTSVLLTWVGPDPTTSTPMNEFRLLSSRYGFPVDENDGAVVFDVTTQPGTRFVDQNVVPGEITYYGFYILADAGQWIRAGFTACLMPVSHGYADRLWSFLPEYLRDVDDSELTADNAGDTYLYQFLRVAAWPLDYLKTQLDFLYENQNKPMKMALTDLAALAGQLGMPFTAEIPAYYTRKAAGNWAVVMRERGSLPGIAEHMSLLSGFGADVELSANIMLEDDQSLPLDPVFPPWSPAIPYQQGEIVSWPVYPRWVVSQAYVVNNYVTYNGANYQCTATGGQGVPPAGAVNSGSYWAVASGPYLYQCAQPIIALLPGTPPPGALPPGDFPPDNSSWKLYYDKDAAQGYTAIPDLAGGVGTWEVTWNGTAASIPVGSLTEGVGTRNPSNFANDLAGNTIRVYNKGGSAQNMWLRSLSRNHADVTAGRLQPDPQTVVEHGIPVPRAGAAWDPAARYGTGSAALWQGVSYLALRASTGARPPSPGIALNATSDFEAGAAPWTAAGGSPVTGSAAFAFHGTKSLLLTPNGTDAVPAAVSERVPVIPGAAYGLSAAVYMPAAWTLGSGGVQAAVTWYDAWGQQVSVSAGNAVAVPAAAWTLVQAAGQAPVNAAACTLSLQVIGTPGASHVSYWDLAVLECTATPEWAPLGADARVPLMISAQAIQNVSQSTAAQYQLYPFVEWYDSWGNMITRVFSRNAAAGLAGTPTGYTYDSFATGPGTPLAGRVTDTGDQAWTVLSGDWRTDGQGSAYPVAAPGSVAGVTAPATCTQAVSFTQAPAAGDSPGLVFWRRPNGNYWIATMTGLYSSASGTLTKAASYATVFQPGDRVYVATSRTVPSVAVYRNQPTAYDPVSGNGLVAQVSGSGVPAAVLPGSSEVVYTGLGVVDV